MRTSWLCFFYFIIVSASLAKPSFGDFPSLFDYISINNATHIEVHSDLRELFKKKDIYQEAQIIILSDGDTLLNHLGEIRTRGNARKDICVLPPTKLRFSKSYLTGLNLSTYPTLKLVGACTVSDRDQDYVVVEQLIYEMDRKITDYSFRTKKVKIIYVDTQDRRKPIYLRGFVIEHEDEMATRLQSKIYEIFFKKELLDRRAYIDFSVFQYMIGNTDWKIFNHHNLKVLTNSMEKKAYPVAYDFDYAGLIKAHYAVPNKKLDIRDVTERLYLGPCQSDEEIEITRKRFLALEHDFMNLLQTAKLGKYQYKFCQRYLIGFFESLRDQRDAQRIFSRCIDY